MTSKPKARAPKVPKVVTESFNALSAPLIALEDIGLGLRKHDEDSTTFDAITVQVCIVALSKNIDIELEKIDEFAKSKRNDKAGIHCGRAWVVSAQIAAFAEGVLQDDQWPGGLAGIGAGLTGLARSVILELERTATALHVEFMTPGGSSLEDDHGELFQPIDQALRDRAAARAA